MSTTIGNLAVTLGLDSAKFRSGMKSSLAATKRLTAGIARGTARLLRYGSVMGAVAAGALAIATKRSFSFIDATAKVADTLDIGTKALQRLRFAGLITGVSIQGMDKALQQFTRRLGDAQDGTGEYAEALDKLGLSSKELSSIPLDKAFVKVAEAI